MPEASEFEKPITGRGGRRPGAGRPKGTGGTGHKQKVAKAEGEENPYVQLTRAKLKHEAAKANLAELKYKEAAGQLIPAEKHMRELAAAFKVLATGLESLPDRLEHDCALDAALVEKLQEAIDGFREDLYQRLMKNEKN